MADAVGDVLDDGDGPDWAYFKELCAGPPRPLYNETWLDATLTVLELTWNDVLEALRLAQWRRAPGPDGLGGLTDHE